MGLTTASMDAIERVLGFGGLLIAIAGASSIIALGGNTAFAIAALIPLVVAGVAILLSWFQMNSIVWILSATWTGFLGVLSLFSVGIIMLIATVFLLAAFIRANW